MNNLTILAMIKDGLPLKHIAKDQGVCKKTLDNRLRVLRIKHKCPTTTALICKVYIEKIEV